MTKNLLLLSLAILIQSATNAQIWQAVSPYPDPSITRASVVDSLHIRALGKSNTFHYTNDGGALWTKVNLPQNNYNDIHFIDANNGWISSDSGLMHTTNGGQLFTPISQVSGRIVQIYFPDHLHGKALMRGLINDSILITNDSGNSWSAYSLGSTSFTRRFYFTSPYTAWMIVMADIYKSTDGGITWTQQVLPSNIGSSLNHKSGVFFLDSLQGWISGLDSVMHTIDGGQTWTCISHIFYGSIVFRDSLNGVVENLYQVSSTHDGGYTWTIADLFDANLQYSGEIELSVSDNMFFVNGNGYVLKSPDGENWDRLAYNSFPSTLSAYYSYMSPKLSFTSRQKGMFKSGTVAGPPIGTNDVYVTVDSGNTWKNIHLAINTPGIQLLNDTLWFAWAYTHINYETTLYRSTDNFNTTPQFISSMIGPAVFYFTDSMHGVSYWNSSDTLKYTLDGGFSWFNSNLVLLQGKSITNFVFVDTQNGWGWGHDIFRTYDGGMSWTQIYTNTVQFSEISKVYFTNTSKGYYIMTFPNDTTTLYQTSDGGVTWTPQYFPYSVWDMHFVDSLHGWLATHQGVYYTSDGLNTFSSQDNHSIEFLSFYDNAHGYASSNYLLLYTDQISNGSDEKSNRTEIVIFPNPATNSTFIKANKIIESVIMYDMQGILVKRVKAIKNKSMEINLNLKSGVYIISIFFQDHSNCIKKLVVD